MGRGATPQRSVVAVAPRPNPQRRSQLRFRYRPLKAWEPARLETVEALLLEYFTLVGGFRVAGDAVLRAWYDLLDDFTPQEIRWAIEAKAESLRGQDEAETLAKRVFIPRAENFPLSAGEWLAKCRAYREGVAQAVTAERDAALRDRLAEIALSAAPAPLRETGISDRERIFAVESRTPLSPEQHDADQQRRAAQRARASAPVEPPRLTQRRARWDALSARQQRIAWAAVKQQWFAQIENYGWHARSDEARGLRLMLAMGWSERQWPEERGA